MDNRAAQAVTFEQSGHIALVHDKCDKNGCMICDGGLFVCTRCGSHEGATTTHCPGGQMTAETYEKVYAGELDYREDEWVRAGSPHTPYRGWELYRD